MELSCATYFFEAFCKASAWNCGAKVAFPQATCQAFAWNCRAKVALRSYFLSFCMELSYKSCLVKLFFSFCRRLLRVRLAHNEVSLYFFAWFQRRWLQLASSQHLPQAQFSKHARPQDMLLVIVGRLAACSRMF